MIKYKRIYPLRQNGRLAAIVTACGGNDSAEVLVKFKMKLEEDGLYLVFFNPKTYEYEMLPLKDRTCLNRSLTGLSGCAIISKNGMLVDILMEGTIDKSRINTSKLKSAIAMDLYSSCTSDDRKEENDNAELMDYLREMESTAPFPDTEDAAPSTAKVSAAGEEADMAQMQEQEAPIETDDTAAEAAAKPFTRVENGAGALKYHKLINPFKDRWNGLWWQVKYPDKDWHYIVGRVRIDGDNLSVLGVPGEKDQKPASMEDCDMYEIAENGIGYWLIFQKS